MGFEWASSMTCSWDLSFTNLNLNFLNYMWLFLKTLKEICDSLLGAVVVVEPITNKRDI
jgi:hypothetical protein